MRWIVRASIVLSAAWVAGLEPAAAAQDSPLPDGWRVDWADLDCSLSHMRNVAPSPTLFIAQKLPGSPRWRIVLVSRQWLPDAVDDADELTVTFQPEGAPVTGRARIDRTRGDTALIVNAVPERQIEPLAAAESIRVDRRGQPVLTIPLPGAARALAAVRECESRVLRDWGIDPAARPPTPPEPRANPASLIQPGDYPVEALTGGHDGTVVVRLAVGADGRVTDCATVASSGHAGLDQRTCAIMRQRLRFSPARDAEGNPVQATAISYLTWSIRGSPR